MVLRVGRDLHPARVASRGASWLTGPPLRLLFRHYPDAVARINMARKWGVGDVRNRGFIFPTILTRATIALMYKKLKTDIAFRLI